MYPFGFLNYNQSLWILEFLTNLSQFFFSLEITTYHFGSYCNQPFPFLELQPVLKLELSPLDPLSYNRSFLIFFKIKPLFGLFGFLKLQPICLDS
jgi:hypothetical protein